jgi:hypothetical protein
VKPILSHISYEEIKVKTYKKGGFKKYHEKKPILKSNNYQYI